MQNDFVHPEGGFAHRARENPEANIDMPFLMGAVGPAARLAAAVRKAGRPVVYIAHELKPQDGEHLVIKKGFGGSSNTPLDTILRNLGVTPCVVCGVTTCVCVSTTVRGGVEHNYRMILASDAVAEVHRDAHEAELRTMQRVFAEV